jgi:hypothetical protein
MTTFNDLTADIKSRHVGKESKRLVEKWDKTKLLKGLKESRAGGFSPKHNMARLLENQAAEIVRQRMISESSEMADIKGFQSVAFPLVRRIFGGLIANELVSVQPMSLPSGLLFYLDYTFGTANKGGNQNLDWTAGGSVYGDQTAPGTENLGTGGHYGLNSSYSAREVNGGAMDVQASGSATLAQVDYDFELSGAVTAGTLWYVDVAFTSSSDVSLANLDLTNVTQYSISGSDALWAGVKGLYKRHNTLLSSDTGVVRMFFSASAALDHTVGITGSYVKATGLTVNSSGVVLSPVFETDFSTDFIPEIDIKISAVSVTAQTRKLKVKWTPELAQDLNAYHDLDAEVELTQVMSEQIALDIDREILSQLLSEATGATMYWSRQPGKFVNKLSGATTAGSFTGNIQEWYSTLVEVCIDVSNVIHRKTLRGAANFMVVGPDVATILENTIFYKPALSMDPNETQFAMGIEKIGSLNNRFTIYKDPYFPRNQVLIGYKGNSFLETGFVYAPYVPLIVTPTIFRPDDFAPTKGVMTRYAKKMTRSDFYGKVVILDMDR